MADFEMIPLSAPERDCSLLLLRLLSIARLAPGSRRQFFTAESPFWSTAVEYDERGLSIELLFNMSYLICYVIFHTPMEPQYWDIPALIELPF